MSHAILFHFLCAQHVSDINIYGWVGVVSVLQAEACNTDTTPTPKLQHTSNQEQYDQCGNSTE